MKNKFISIFTLMCLLISLPITSYALSGKGTESNPFRISTEEELLLLADFPECYFELENDIEISSIWEPVADFSGVFDGKGHTITVSDYTAKTNTGFFSMLSGTVKNLTINANNISKTTASSMNLGLFAGYCSGKIENCTAIGNITGATEVNGKMYMGGFCATLSGSIKNSKAQFELFKTSSYFNAGGICETLSGTVEQCANLSNVMIVRGMYGGIACNSENGSMIKDSMNLEASIKGNPNRYAGISYQNYGTITNCYSVGGSADFSGIGAGVAMTYSSGTMSNCYYDKIVLGNSETSFGIPKSTLAMKMDATYKDWDFENVWGIDESEENPINDGYPYLKAFYEDVETPVTISSLSTINDKLVIDTKITDISDDYTLHIALYDNQNRLCDYLSIPNERQLKDVFVVYPDNGNATYAKIFTWYSTDNIEPVSTCETVTIER